MALSMADCTAPAISRSLAPATGPGLALEDCGDLETAVSRASEDARPGETVLLSPSCASFDQFTDYEDRGNRFRRLVGTADVC